MGDFGPSAYDFIDFLSNARQSVWQILPLNPFSSNGSPYYSSSSFAIDPLFISLQLLQVHGLLDLVPDIQQNNHDFDRINYELVRKQKLPLLDQAFKNWCISAGNNRNEFQKFIFEQRFWLIDFARFEVLSCFYRSRDWASWSDHNHKNYLFLDRDETLKSLNKEIFKAYFLQYIAHEQWRNVRSYAHRKGVRILGDSPMYVAPDSADVWAHQNLFQLEQASGRPLWVAGVPPDAFNRQGQVWGGALYDWLEAKRNNFLWWQEKFLRLHQLYDFLRLDHFIGFCRYWPLPSRGDNQGVGSWRQVPGRSLLHVLSQKIDFSSIVVEDLGAIGHDVEALRDDFSLVGMKVLQFGFGEEGNHQHRPHNFSENFLVCTGTHDNLPVSGWFKSLSDDALKEEILDYFNCLTSSELAWGMIRAAYASVAKMVIIPMQDVLGLGEEARINQPGVSAGNWQWRFGKYLYQCYYRELSHLTCLYDRCA